MLTMETKMKQEAKDHLNPYLAGFLLGLTLLASFLVLGAGLGASGGLARVAAWAEGTVAPQHTLGSEYFGAWGEGPLNYYLVDLPGYGYARCSKAVRDKWAKLIDRYVQGNRLLRGMAVLLDCRLEPQQNDLNLTAWLQHLNLPMLAVLTKADKCTQKERARRQRQWADLLGSQQPPLLFSAKSGQGREGLWTRLDALVSPEDAAGPADAPAAP
jgi:ribosome biogenesis GTP-binding protein YsxC/EngB